MTSGIGMLILRCGCSGHGLGFIFATVQQESLEEKEEEWGISERGYKASIFEAEAVELASNKMKQLPASSSTVAGNPQAEGGTLRQRLPRPDSKCQATWHHGDPLTCPHQVHLASEVHACMHATSFIVVRLSGVRCNRWRHVKQLRAIHTWASNMRTGRIAGILDFEKHRNEFQQQCEELKVGVLDDVIMMYECDDSTI